MVTVPDSLDLPGRPTHRDLSILSSIVLRNDARSDDPLFLGELLGEGVGAVREAAVHEGQAHARPELSLLHNLVVAWMIGLGAGVAASRGETNRWTDPALVSRPVGHVLGGVDLGSVQWTARQRAQRLASRYSAPVPLKVRETAVAASWLDGFVAGRQYDGERIRLTFG